MKARAAGRIERVLVEAHHQDALVAVHDVLGAVAVVHVEVDDGHALEAMALAGVFGGNGDVAEEAKTHGHVARGVVAGRAGGAKGVFQLAAQHGVHGVDGGAGRQQGGAPGVGVHRGVGVDRKGIGPAGGDLLGQDLAQAAQGGHVAAAVRQQQLAHGGGRGLAPLQRVGHAGDQEAVFDGVDARRALGVTGAHVMQSAVRMNEIAGSSQFLSPRCPKSA